MKKIIFCLQTMVLGGVEKELITILNKINNQFEITLLLLYVEDKELLSEIPENVRIVNLEIDKDYYYGSTFNLIRSRIKRGHLLEATSLAFKRIFNIGTTGSNLNINDIQIIDDIFDVAICYHIHSPIMMKYTAQKIKASKKVAWIHNDFYTTKYPIERLKDVVLKYDEFVAVSKKVEHEFRSICNWYHGDVSTAYNYLDAEEIIKLSEEEVEDQQFTCESKTKILTIGRFSEQKGIDLAIETASLLKKNKVGFHWFLIGYGELENEYRRLIEQYEVLDCFTILGKKQNPYPYIRKCDVLVQPSRHEAYPLVIMEAKILKKPIICTNFDGADEQIDSGVNGMIVPLNDIVALNNAVSQIVLSPQLRECFSKSLEGLHGEDNLKSIISHF